MKALLPALFFVMTSITVQAQSLNEFQWKSRLVVLFTPDQGDPLFEEQMRLLYLENDAFQDRNVVFMLVAPEGKYENTGRFLDEADAAAYYDRFNPEQYEFTLLLVGLDGHEKFRSANRIVPPSVLLNLIDRMPMRRQEMLQGTTNKSQISDKSNKQNSAVVKKRRNY